MHSSAIFVYTAFAVGYAMGPAPAHGQTLTTLYSFTDGADGASPGPALLYVNGNIIGTAVNGGTFNGNCKSGNTDYGCGTVFQVPSSGGSISTIYSFKGASDGQWPSGGVVQRGASFYGTTTQGGDNNYGTVFKVSNNGAHKVLYDFAGAPDGSLPQATMTKVGDAYYGTTYFGGSSRAGSIYKYAPKTHTESVVYSFTGVPDGDSPGTSMVYVNGILYGTTVLGGGVGCGDSGGCGTVFSLNPSTGAETVLHEFNGGTDGAYPMAPMIYKEGTLYGITDLGGSDGCSHGGCGVAFSIDIATGAYQILHIFGGKDGRNPQSLLFGGGSLLYGTAGGGKTGHGTIFAVDRRNGRMKLAWTFAGGAAGSYPGGLIYASGAFYGTTYGGGVGCGGSGCGTIFKFEP